MAGLRAYYAKLGNCWPQRVVSHSRVVLASTLLSATGLALCASVAVAQTSNNADEPGAAVHEVPSTGPWTVDRLVQEIVTTNPRIQSQTAAAKAARYEVSAARWQYFPSPALQAETAGKDRQFVASVTQPLFSFGRLGADLRSAKSKAQLADVRVDEARYILAFRVLDLYGQFASAKRSEAVFQDDVTRLSALGELISRRVTAGASAPVDLNLVLTRIRQSENALISTRTKLVNARASLEELLGRPIPQADIVVPQSEALLPDAEPSISADAVRQSLSNNPVLRRAEGEIDVAKFERERAFSALKPTIFGRVEQRFDHGRYDVSTFPRSRALVGVQYSVGSGLSSLVRIKAAAAQQDVARLSLEAARADARTAIMNDLETYEASRRLVASLRANVDVQQETVSSYNRLFLAGKRSWLDVLNMARELTGSQRDLADADVQLLLSSYRIRLQTGQLSW